MRLATTAMMVLVGVAEGVVGIIAQTAPRSIPKQRVRMVIKCFAKTAITKLSGL